MNILFYLVPKSEVMYLYDDYSLRQAMEKMELFNLLMTLMKMQNSKNSKEKPTLLMAWVF